MKTKNLTLLILKVFIFLNSFAVYSQGGGLHIQWHKDAQGSFYQYNTDSLYVPLKIANSSTYNAIGVLNLRTEQWDYITSVQPFSFSLAVNPMIIMKDANTGVCAIGGYAAHLTSNNWQSSTAQTSTVTVSGANNLGYFGYANNTGTYTTYYSSNTTTWNAVHTSTMFPYFSKTKTKVYTIFNSQLKVSSNGGASYTTVNPTVSLGGPIYTPNDDTLYVASTQLMRSFDAGVTWSAVPYPSANPSQIACKNGKEIMIIDQVANPKTVYYSNTSGNSWTTYTTLPAFFSSEKLIAGSEAFYLYPGYRSTNGATWSDFLAASPAPKPYDVTITNNLVLAAYAQGYFGYSKNYGHNFTFLPNKIPSNIDAMATKAINQNLFLIADRKGQIFTSTDQGATWNQKTNSTVNNVPRKFTMSQNSNTVVLSCLGAPYVSVNGASTFSFINVVGGGSHYQTIKPQAGTVIDVCGIFSPPSFNLSGWQFYAFNTSTLGTVIGSVSALSTEEIIDIEMRDDNVGYFLTRNIANNETIVYKTTDGWVTTTSITAIQSPTASIRSYDGRYGKIQLFGTDTVIISGSGNPTNNQTTYYHVSTNAGTNWQLNQVDFSRPTTALGNRVYQLSFFNKNNYIGLISNNLCGSGQASIGVYLKNNNTTLTPTDLNYILPEKTTNTLRCFPNPTNSELMITKEGGFLHSNIMIYDVLGKLHLKENNYSGNSIELACNNLITGVYLVVVEENGKTLNTKFIKR